MTREEYIEKEVAAKEAVMRLNPHNKSTLRLMLGKEFDQEERSTRDYRYGYDEDGHTKGDVREY
jgi:hypothetical protein